MLDILQLLSFFNALVSGFVIPEFVGRASAEPADMRLGIALAYSVNQVCARMGVIALLLAISLWSLTLVQRGGLSKVAATIGGFVGPLSIIGTLSGHFHMNVHGMMLLVFSHTIWNLLVAAQLLRNRI